MNPIKTESKTIPLKFRCDKCNQECNPIILHEDGETNLGGVSAIKVETFVQIREPCWWKIISKGFFIFTLAFGIPWTLIILINHPPLSDIPGLGGGFFLLGGATYLLCFSFARSSMDDLKTMLNIKKACIAARKEKE